MFELEGQWEVIAARHWNRNWEPYSSSTSETKGGQLQLDPSIKLPHFLS